ncbi:MAG: hypothetical protein JXR03_19950 [Cyclobacteriaceae bacterium]
MLEDILKLDQQPTLTSIHIARSRIQPKNQNLSKSMAAPPHRTNELTETENQNGEKHENLTDAKIHRLTEVLANVCWVGYFTDIYKCSAYGF